MEETQDNKAQKKTKKVSIKKPKEYFSARTSRLAKKIGDSLLILGGVADVIADLPSWGHKTLVGVAVAGKLITNFFKEEE